MAYLDHKVTQLQLCEYLSEQFEALCIWNHGVILTSNVKVLVKR